MSAFVYVVVVVVVRLNVVFGMRLSPLYGGNVKSLKPIYQFVSSIASFLSSLCAHLVSAFELRQSKSLMRAKLLVKLI